MQVMKGMWLFLFCGLWIVGCGPQVRPSEYHAWVHDVSHGMLKSSVGLEQSWQCVYLPTDYMIVNELRSDEIVSSTYASLKAWYGSSVYFKLLIPRDESRSFNALDLEADLMEHLVLENGRQEIHLSACHVESDGFMGPEYRVMLSFPIDFESLNRFQLKYVDLFHFEYDRSEMLIPNLKY